MAMISAEAAWREGWKGESVEVAVDRDDVPSRYVDEDFPPSRVLDEITEFLT